jgi:LemA protein
MKITVALATIGFIIVWTVATHNRFVRKLNEVRNAWSQIDVQLKRRHDLIPNIVNAVQGYMEHERRLFEQVAFARQHAATAGNRISERSAAETSLSAAMRSLTARIENYPNLKANSNVLDLQEELRSTENRIGFARQFYNDAVMEFNTALRSFPANLVASAFSFAVEPFFEAELTEGPAGVVGLSPTA